MQTRTGANTREQLEPHVYEGRESWNHVGGEDQDTDICTCFHLQIKPQSSLKPDEEMMMMGATAPLIQTSWRKAPQVERRPGPERRLSQRAEGCPDLSSACPLICSPGCHAIHHPSARHTATFFTHNKAFILIL